MSNMLGFRNKMIVVKKEDFVLNILKPPKQKKVV